MFTQISKAENAIKANGANGSNGGMNLHGSYLTSK